MLEDNKTILAVLNINSSDRNVLTFDITSKKVLEINIKADQFVISHDNKLAIFYGKNSFIIY